MDQAEKLRSMLKKATPMAPAKDSPMRVISITSGKGGVGKTNFAINLSICLSRAGKRVIIIDADFGLANVELLMGVSPRYSFKDVLAGQVSVQDALTQGPEGVRFLSGGSGLTQLSDVTAAQIDVLLTSFSQLEQLTDILIIDTGAGMSKTVTNLLKASHEIIVVTTSDPTAIADAYTIIKAIVEDNKEPPPLKMVINRVESQKEGVEVFTRLHRVCGRFLKIFPQSLGNIPYDKQLTRAVKAQEPVILLYPNAESSRCIQAICKRLLNQPEPTSGGIKSFIDRWIWSIKS